MVGLHLPLLTNLDRSFSCLYLVRLHFTSEIAFFTRGFPTKSLMSYGVRRSAIQACPLWQPKGRLTGVHRMFERAKDATSAVKMTMGNTLGVPVAMPSWNVWALSSRHAIRFPGETPEHAKVVDTLPSLPRRGCHRVCIAAASSDACKSKRRRCPPGPGNSSYSRNCHTRCMNGI